VLAVQPSRVEKSISFCCDIALIFFILAIALIMYLSFVVEG